VQRFLESHPSITSEFKSVYRSQFTFDILRRPLYAGFMTIEKWGLHMHPAKHEPLITLETWQKIQDRLDGKSYKRPRPRVHEDFPLRHYVACPSCDTPMYSAWPKGKTKSYPYYLCQQKGCERKNKSIPKAEIEGAFAAIAKSLTPRPQLLAAAKAMFAKIWEARLNNQKEQHNASLEHATKIDTKITKLIDRIMNSTSERVIAAYEKELDVLERQKRDLTNKAAQPLEPAQPFETAFGAAMEFLTKPWKLWESGEYDKQRLLLKLALPKPLTYCRQNGFSNTKLSLPFKVLGDFDMQKNEMVRPRSRIFALNIVILQ